MKYFLSYNNIFEEKKGLNNEMVPDQFASDDQMLNDYINNSLQAIVFYNMSGTKFVTIDKLKNSINTIKNAIKKFANKNIKKTLFGIVDKLETKVNNNENSDEEIDQLTNLIKK